MSYFFFHKLLRAELADFSYNLDSWIEVHLCVKIINRKRAEILEQKQKDHFDELVAANMW